MNAYNEGDLVEAVKGETHIRGKVWGCEEQFVGLSRRTIPSLINDGFKITALEKAPPKIELPTEPGYYLDNVRDVWIIRHGESRLRFDGSFDAHTELFAPFTRLEPVPETAKKVLDRLSSWWEFGPPKQFAAEFNAIAKEFGVSE